MIEAVGLLTAVLLFLATVGGLIAAYTRELRHENDRLRAENDRLTVLLADARDAPGPGLAYPGDAGYPAPHLAAYTRGEAQTSRFYVDPYQRSSGAPLPTYQEDDHR